MEIDARANGFRSEGEPRTPTTSAAELSQIATDVEAFLGLWVARFERLLDEYTNSSEGDASLQQRIAEFEVVQRRWNEQRQQEVQTIQETTEQLSAAWERLEDEQRRILQTQETLPQRGIERDSAALAKPNAIPTNASPPKAAEAHGAGDLESEEAASVSRDRAVRQFEKLRRQMGIPKP